MSYGMTDDDWEKAQELLDQRKKLGPSAGEKRERITLGEADIDPDSMVLVGTQWSGDHFHLTNCHYLPDNPREKPACSLPDDWTMCTWCYKHEYADA